jgi:hypothetical protein
LRVLRWSLIIQINGFRLHRNRLRYHGGIKLSDKSNIMMCDWPSRLLWT